MLSFETHVEAPRCGIHATDGLRGVAERTVRILPALRDGDGSRCPVGLVVKAAFDDACIGRIRRTFRALVTLIDPGVMELKATAEVMIDGIDAVRITASDKDAA